MRARAGLGPVWETFFLGMRATDKTQGCGSGRALHRRPYGEMRPAVCGNDARTVLRAAWGRAQKVSLIVARLGQATRTACSVRPSMLSWRCRATARCEAAKYRCRFLIGVPSVHTTSPRPAPASGASCSSRRWGRSNQLEVFLERIGALPPPSCFATWATRSSAAPGRHAQRLAVEVDGVRGQREMCALRRRWRRAPSSRVAGGASCLDSDHYGFDSWVCWRCLGCRCFCL